MGTDCLNVWHAQGPQLLSKTLATCDLVGPTIGDLKALPGRPHEGRLSSPQQIWSFAGSSYREGLSLSPTTSQAAMFI